MAGGNISPKLGPLFAEAGAKFHIPPQVLAGVASVETGLGSDRSTSSTGAQGLMQFEPGTARSLGINPYNDRQAVFGAAKLLTQMGYHQNPLRALGAYNGGPGNPQYGYARLVMSEANRLKGQALRYVGASSPSMPGPARVPGARTPGARGGNVSFTPGAFKQVTTQGFDQSAYDQAVAGNIAGNYVAGSNDPYKLPGPKTGLEGLAASNPVLTSGGLTTGPAPNPQDYMTAQTELQKIAGQKITLHPAAVGGQAKNGQPKTQTAPATVGAVNTKIKGVTTFMGKPVADWIAPILQYAKAHGWAGTVNSGYRSYADQKRIYDSGVRPAAVPGTSNHEGSQFPRGAVDVTNAQQLSNILLRSPYARALVYAGSKDPVHFSHPHDGGY